MKAKQLFVMVFLVAASSFIYSFVTPMGGEGFEIYVDNKLVLQQFNQEMKQLKNIQLTEAQSKSELKVKYYHCGMAGKSRILELKNSDQKTVKRWEFDNSEGKNFAITVAVKEILDSQEKLGNGTIYLYYSSKEAPQGRLLAGIVQANKNSVTGK
ncbi:hypothetical protein [Lacibacter sediminis]|uniref:Uncharacterized protein n=1 Tax=Lacibacter sediminis TaxID=2760713 RepID=A0A7G5XC53_9BACT|nr:hypothetical protein [Lacibacter sediminis]QNA43056.1 hypothetical protein H4075_13285 [Lacibacter sediminis]